MSRGINKVTLLGHLGKDPEIRSTAGGTIIATVTLATSDRRKTANGDWEDHTEWHNLVMFNRTAEVARDYLRKGSQCIVEGRIQTRSWDDKDSGEKKYRTEIVVNEMIMLGDSSGQKGYREMGTTAPPANGRHVDQPLPAYAGGGNPAPTANIHGQYIDDDDIPF